MVVIISCLLGGVVQCALYKDCPVRRGPEVFCVGFFFDASKTSESNETQRPDGR